MPKEQPTNPHEPKPLRCSRCRSRNVKPTGEEIPNGYRGYIDQYVVECQDCGYRWRSMNPKAKPGTA